MVTSFAEALKEERLPKAEVVETHEGGKVYQADVWTRFHRGLILGSPNGSFYVKPDQGITDLITTFREAIAEDGLEAVRILVDVSKHGRAPKKDPSLLALAMAMRAENVNVRRAAEKALPDVAEIGTHLLHWAKMAVAADGSLGSRVKSRAVRNWLFRDDEKRGAEWLAYQVAKYQSRDGFSMRDLLILAHPAGKKASPAHDAVLRWVFDGSSGPDAPTILHAMNGLRANPTRAAVLSAIIDHGLTWEMLPTEFLKDPVVWETLLVRMPMMAMVRNLARMTSYGLVTRGSDAERVISDRLRDADRLKQARVHPMATLLAAKVYEQGHGELGKMTWQPSKRIVNALDEAFYLAFGAVESTGKRIRVSVDCSGSMTHFGYGTGQLLSPRELLTPRELAAAMALVFIGTEPRAEILGFSDSLHDLGIRPTMRITDVVARMDSVPSGWTFCSLPIMEAMHQNKDFDAFVQLTDGETADGDQARWRVGGMPLPVPGLPRDLIKQYRASSGIKRAKSITIGMVANSLTLADPADRDMLDVCGLDASVPQIVSDFIAGRIG